METASGALKGKCSLSCNLLARLVTGRLLVFTTLLADKILSACLTSLILSFDLSVATGAVAWGANLDNEGSATLDPGLLGASTRG